MTEQTAKAVNLQLMRMDFFLQMSSTITQARVAVFRMKDKTDLQRELLKLFEAAGHVFLKIDEYRYHISPDALGAEDWPEDYAEEYWREMRKALKPAAFKDWKEQNLPSL